MINLKTKINKIINNKSNMDNTVFKNFIISLLCYRYLSGKIENYNDRETCIGEFGYFIEPNYRYNKVLGKCKKNSFILDDLREAFNELKCFNGLFDTLAFDSLELEVREDVNNERISDMILYLDDIGFDSRFDILGDLYQLLNSLIGDGGKISGEFYTPLEVSKILAKIVSLDKPELRNVYDPTCGSGSLLLGVLDEVSVEQFYGQELNSVSCDLAKINLLLHGVKYGDLDIKQGDTLENPQHMGMEFDAIVANPPYSVKWSADKSFLDDSRFSAYGKLAPKSKADYAFIQHMLYHLKEDGTMAIVLPYGVLFRGAAEGKIREYLVGEKNYLDAVIGLPVNLFYGTSIPSCILVFKKCRLDNDDVLFVDASKSFKKMKNQNKLRKEDIDKIIRTYVNREEISKYSHNATMEEIEDNNFNLNIRRYVDTLEDGPVDLDEVCDELDKIDEEMAEVDAEIKKFCDELGIQAPIFE